MSEIDEVWKIMNWPLNNLVMIFSQKEFIS